MYFYTQNASTDRLKSALEQLDWSSGFVLYGFHPKLGTAVEEVLKNQKQKLVVDHTMYILVLSRDKGAQIEVVLVRFFFSIYKC